MLIASRQRLSKFSESPALVHDSTLEQIASAKSLGAYIGQFLNWEHHIDICKKIASAVGAIKRMRHQILSMY